MAELNLEELRDRAEGHSDGEYMLVVKETVLDLIDKIDALNGEIVSLEWEISDLRERYED